MKIKEARIERLERDEEDVRKFNFKAKYLCMSSVCKHHHEQNGELFNADFIRENYGVEMVPDDCKCAFSLVLLNESGNPISSVAIEKVKAHKVQHN